MKFSICVPHIVRFKSENNLIGIQARNQLTVEGVCMTSLQQGRLLT